MRSSTARTTSSSRKTTSCIVSRDGWVKRQKEVKDVARPACARATRCWRSCPAARARASVFFTNFGVAYTARFVDVPASTGYGEPIQRLFKLKDGERIVAALSLDPRVTGTIARRRGRRATGARARRHERRLRAALRPGALRRAEHASRPAFARPADGAEVVGVARVTGERDHHRRDARGARGALQGRRGELPVGPGPRRHPDQDRARRRRVLGFIASTGDRDLMTVETSRGASRPSAPRNTRSPARGGKGRELLQRGQFTRVVPTMPDTPPPLEE